MSSISLRFRASKKTANPKGRLFFRIIHNRECCVISSEHKIYNHEWNSKCNTIRYPLANARRAKELEQIHHKLQEQQKMIQKIISELATKGNFRLKEIQLSYDLTKHSNSFCHFVQHLTSSIKGTQERTAKAYITACKRALEFNRGMDFPLEHINASFVKSFETHLKKELLKPNTISFYMRNLRSIFNKAIALKRIPKPLDNIFEGVYTGVQTTKKRALDTLEVFRIISLDMEEVMKHCKNEYRKSNPTAEQMLQVEMLTDKYQKKLELAQDIFSFSFFSRGMSFVDLAYLKKSDIENDVITYHRKKTGQQLEISITDKLQTILEKYKCQMQDSDYIFPIITDSQKSGYQQYQSGLSRQNRLLKELAQYSQITKNISTHVARHSWATIAKKENTPVWEISESLGHSSVKTTYIYLASFERFKLDKVNERVALAVNNSQSITSH